MCASHLPERLCFVTPLYWLDRTLPLPLVRSVTLVEESHVPRWMVARVIGIDGDFEEEEEEGYSPFASLTTKFFRL